MKNKIYIIFISLITLSSCIDYLEEEPTGFLSPDSYYKTADQIQAAVNGTYVGLSSPLGTSDLEVATSDIFALEYVTGYSKRSRSSGFNDNQFLLLQQLDPNNGHLQAFWNATFIPLENCNSVIANLSETQVIPEATKNKYLGEVYFLRAYYYFQAVRLFGAIPLKTEPTTDIANVEIPRNTVAEIYDQIVADLQMAENSGLPWTDVSGHVNMGAIKALLAKVYLTMAGFPLQKGAEYYQMAYDKAAEVVDSEDFYLFENYSDIRNIENMGENIFMIQREPQIAPNNLHFSLMPYPEKPISINPSYGGGLTPTDEFYNAFDDADLRKAEQTFFYTQYPEYGNPDNIIDLGGIFIYKYWDELAEETGRSGANIPLIRYADVLLTLAEAKAAADGGTTADAKAIDAYFAVRNRAFPSETLPASITTDQVLMERFKELSFEFETWYDMMRTRKAWDVVNGGMVNLLGYQAPNHTRAFTESDLVWPVPLRETQQNPLLSE